MILDEADEMLNQGYRDQLDGICATMPQEQKEEFPLVENFSVHLDPDTRRRALLLLFCLPNTCRDLDLHIASYCSVTHTVREAPQFCAVAATLPHEVEELCGRIMRDPHRVFVGERTGITWDVHQYYVQVEESSKMDVLADLFEAITTRQCFVFCNTSRKAAWVHSNLEKTDVSVALLHSEMPQQERALASWRFCSGPARVLVCTDWFFRCVEVAQVPLVINFDMPAAPKIYLSRAGLTGRYGKRGCCISFVEDPHREIAELERFYATSINKLPDNIGDFFT